MITSPAALAELERERRLARQSIISRARRWAEKGGLNWSDERWERELAALRYALTRLDEANR